MNRTAGSILSCLACGFSANSEPEWPDYTCPKCAALNVRLYRKEHRSASIARRLTPDEIRAEFEAARPFSSGWVSILNTIAPARQTPVLATAKGHR